MQDKTTASDKHTKEEDLYLFHEVPRILVWNFKGGAGKTSTTVGLASALNMLGYRVIVIDCDAQINSSLYFQQGIGRAQPFTGTLKDYIDGCGDVRAKDLLRTFTFCRTPGYDGSKDFFFVTEESTEETIPAPDIDKAVTRQCTISLIPGDLNLGASDFSDLGTVKRMIEELTEDYDGKTIILCDCAPQLVPASNPVLFAGNRLLVPTLASNDSIYGIPTVLNIMNEVREAGVDLKLLGLFINNLDMREAVPKELAVQLRTAVQGTDTYLFDAVVRHSASVEKARSLGIVPLVYEFGKDYQTDLVRLALETVNRLIMFDKEVC